MLERINQAYRDIATVVEPSVVHISAQYMDRDSLGVERAGISTGSGWVYDDQGHIVTNNHVILNAVRIDVQLHNGTVREATLVGSDPSTDIAVIKITPGLLHPAQLADLAAPVKQGDLVFAFGSPFDFRFSMSSGVVSGKDRSVGVLRDEAGVRIGYENFIQVDAAINPGNSGGPLTDYRGHVIGMNTAIATGTRRYNGGLDEGQFAGIGLAIPLDMIYPVVTQLIKNGYVEKGFLGVNVPLNADDNSSRLARLGFNGNGIVITAVRDNEAAAIAGVQPDDVVTHVNGRPVGTVPQLQSIVSSMLPGESATLTIWRTQPERQVSQMMEISVPLARLDMLRATGQIPPNQPRDSIVGLGIARMATSTPELAEGFGAAFRPGVIIQGLVPDSRLSTLIGAGTIIVAVNDFTVGDVDEFIAALRSTDFSRQGARAEAYDSLGRRLMLRLAAE